MSIKRSHRLSVHVTPSVATKIMDTLSLILFIYSLLNDAVSNPEYTVSNDMMLSDNKL